MITNAPTSANSATSVSSIEKLMPLNLQTDMYHGLPFRVTVSPDVPKIQISEDCPLTDVFRAEMNAWCLSFFGTTNSVADNEVIVVGGSTLVVSPRTFNRLSKEFVLDKRTYPYTNPGAFW